MADNQENVQISTFSIQDTMDMGAGNTELLNDLFASETATATPETITPIPPAAPAKTDTPPAETTKKDEPSKTSIADFLARDEKDDDDDEDDKEKKDAPTPPAAATTTTDDDDDNDENVETSRFTALSNDLFKLGVFNKDEGEEDVTISTPEEFLERFNSEKKKGAIQIVDDFIGQFGEDYQQAFDAIFVKGVSPKEYFGTYNKIMNFAELDLKREDNQVAVLKQALADQGFDSEDIDTEITRLKNYGDLESVSAKHHKVLIKKEAAKLQQLEQQQTEKLQREQAYKQQYVQNVQAVLQDKLKAKEFDGIPINQKLANELQSYLIAEKYQTPSGERLTEFDKQILDLKKPENHAMKVKVGLLMKILESDPTLSTIQKRGITKKSDTLFAEVARQTSKSGVKDGKSAAQSSSWFSQL